MLIWATQVLGKDTLGFEVDEVNDYSTTCKLQCGFYGVSNSRLCFRFHDQAVNHHRYVVLVALLQRLSFGKHHGFAVYHCPGIALGLKRDKQVLELPLLLHNYRREELKLCSGLERQKLVNNRLWGLL